MSPTCDVTCVTCKSGCMSSQWRNSLHSWFRSIIGYCAVTTLLTPCHLYIWNRLRRRRQTVNSSTITSRILLLANSSTWSTWSMRKVIHFFLYDCDKCVVAFLSFTTFSIPIYNQYGCTICMHIAFVTSFF